MRKNLLFIAPQACPGHYRFLQNLQRYGINVLAIGLESKAELTEEVRLCLTDYRQVPELEGNAQLLRIAKELSLAHGRIDWIESHTEHYLMLEAILRQYLNVPGKKIAETAEMRRKSLMKEKFRQAKVAVAAGTLVHSLDEALGFAEQHGYPLVLKPDDGMGAEATHRIDDRQSLEQYFAEMTQLPCFLEEFIEGHVVTFDGLVDRNGKIVYWNSLRYNNNLLDVVLTDSNMSDYCVREIEPDLEAAGRRVVEAYNHREKFFHIEFFRRHSDNLLFGLEVNMRPPGGPTIEMWNYADDIDLYEQWAKLLATGTFTADWARRYFVAFVGRRRHFVYKHDDSQVMERWGKQILWNRQVDGLFKEVLGDQGFLVRSPDLSELRQAIAYIHELAIAGIASELEPDRYSLLEAILT